MPELPDILKRCELPIGTRVEVLKYHEEHSFDAIVRGYDISHSKFEVGREFWFGNYAEGGTWVFPGEIAAYYLNPMGEAWRPEPHPEPPEPMPWSEYAHLVGQPVEGRWTQMPDHIYGEPEVRIVRGVLAESDGGHHQIQHFYGHRWERFPWESVRALDYDELTKQDMIDWLGNDPKAAMEFSFEALWSKRKIEMLNADSLERLRELEARTQADRERREAAREAAIEDMRH